MNPTEPRSRPIALPAAKMLDAWSSRRASVVSGSPTRFARGIRNDATLAAANTSEPKRNTQGPPIVFRRPAATDAPIVPASTEMSCNLELARTSSDSSSTTPGTSELFAMFCPFESTREPKARG